MFARTPRLMLRPGWIEDAPALVAAIGDEATVRNLSRVPWPYRIEDAQRFLASEAERLPSFLVFLRGRGAPELIGGVGLHHGEVGEPEIGYWIARDQRGRGFATEAAEAVVRLAHASLRCKRLVAGHYLDNPASGRVLRKLGFRPTGRVRELFSLARGTREPCALFEREAAEADMGRTRPLAA